MKAGGRVKIFGRMICGILLVGVILSCGVSVGKAADCAEFSNVAYKYLIPQSNKSNNGELRKYELGDATGFGDFFSNSLGALHNPLFTYTVKVSAGAIVTCQTNNSKAVVLNADEEDVKEEVDYYHFSIGKPGVVHKIVAKLGDVETVLTFQVEKPKKETVGIKNAKYDPKQGSEYGVITADNDIFCCKLGSSYISVRNHKICNQSLSWNRIELTKEKELENWEKFLLPAVKRGRTIKLIPAVARLIYKTTSGEEVFTRGEIFPLTSGTYIRYKGVEYNSYYDGQYVHDIYTYDKNIVVSLYNLQVKEAKVKIPLQKKAPQVKVDVIKGILSTTAAQEYSVRSDVSANEKFSEWTEAPKKLKLSQIVCSNGILSGASIRVRLRATNKALASRYTTVVIPAQNKLKASTITAEGTITNASITIGKFDITSNPYEYSTTKPSEDTKWIKVLSKKMTFRGTNAFPGTIYIREQGMNENVKKSLSLKLPSSYVTITYDEVSKKWNVN